MKTSIISVIVLMVVGALAVGLVPSREETTIRRAWEVRNARDMEMMSESGWPAERMGYTEEELSALRWKNFTKEHYPNVATIVEVFVSKTEDTGEYVITLFDVDGNRFSFWVDGEEENKLLPVRSLSPY